ncbi:hypothetical protein CS022_05475 [Veronia nyctiphanis]|uniref:G8 domain-containing protein n=1 Tax=Veronia nyctiphanis TaxID=1278244 RepID=A0A4Q0YS90_9GAMM|nr:G8 domain-containing protein [Veronia nyctiphanis]RXJ74087.1 hypothetical protein CS022_05475 [Veronia nyctiphanis]
MKKLFYLFLVFLFVFMSNQILAFSVIPKPVVPLGIKGYVDELTNGTILGWACDHSKMQSIDVHIYAQNEAGNRKFIDSTTANLSNELDIINRCSSGASATHRFTYTFSDQQKKKFAGQRIIVFGISLDGIDNHNKELTKSGAFSLPNFPGNLLLSQLSLDENGNINIPIDTVVTLDSVQRDNSYITVNGLLKCPDQGKITISTRGIIVKGSQAELLCGEKEAPFNGQLTLKLTGEPDDVHNAKRGIMITDNATLNLHTPASDVAKRTRLSSSVDVGDQRITLLGNMPGWNVGDKIVIATTSFSVHENEERVISEISFNQSETTVLLDEPLAYYHHGETESFTNDKDLSWTLDQRAHVINLKRNIIIEGPDDSDWRDDGFGAHVMLMSGAKGFLQGVQFKRVGQQGILGRYPFHWHYIGNAKGQYVKDSVVMNSKNRCYTIHGTNEATLDNNACYDHEGHGYFLEDGNETKNVITNNIGILSRRPPVGKHLLFSDIDRGIVDSDPNQMNFGIGPKRAVGPSTFWITHPTNIIENNVSVASEGTGFWMSFAVEAECRENTDCHEKVYPLSSPTLTFSNNQASTNKVGITWDGGIDLNRPISNPRNPGNDFALRQSYYEGDPQPKNLVAYKSANTAVYYRGAPTTFHHSILADSVWNFFVAYNQGLKDSLIVGRSNNNDPADDSNPLNFHSPIGVLLYDGPFHLTNTHFANFDESQVFSTSQEDITSQAMYLIGGAEKFTNIVNDVTFNPEPIIKMNMDIQTRFTLNDAWGDIATTTLRDVGKSLDSYAFWDDRNLFKPNVPINNLAEDCITALNSVETIRCNHGAGTMQIRSWYGFPAEKADFSLKRIEDDSDSHVEYKPNHSSERLYKFPVITQRDNIHYEFELHDIDDFTGLSLGFSLVFDAENNHDISPIIFIPDTFPHCAVSTMHIIGMQEVSHHELVSGKPLNAFARLPNGIAMRMNGSPAFKKIPIDILLNIGKSIPFVSGFLSQVNEMQFKGETARNFVGFACNRPIFGVQFPGVSVSWSSFIK